jgi:acyl carrier protein
MDHLESIRDFIVTNFLFGDGDQLAEETSFMEKGIIDSTGILELVMFLEETYGIKIEDNELVPENLDNLVNVAGFINRKLNCDASA